MIENLKHGASPDPIDERDFAFSATVPVTVDWTKGSRLPRPLLIDQDDADTCVACAWSYYHWQLKNIQFSRRDLFSRIALAPGQGAYIRDGGLQIIKVGQALQSELPDPSPETETNMREKTGVVAVIEFPYRELSSFVIGNDPDSIAAAILAYKGVVGGLTGSNPGWRNLTVPEPPKAGETTWGHALYFVDFHMHTNSDGTQEKCIIACTSWPEAGITEHHIRQRYFTSGFTFNPWTLIPNQSTPLNMFSKQTANIDGEIGVFISISDPSEIPNMNAVFGTSLVQKPDQTISTDITATSKSATGQVSESQA